MISVRRLLLALGFAFTAYMAARGLWWTGPVEQPLVVVAAVGTYVVTIGVALLWGLRDEDEVAPEPRPRPEARRAERLPLPGAALALAMAGLLPAALSLSVPAEDRTAPYVLWYLGGIGALMVIVMVRGRPLFAWLGLGVLSTSAGCWIGIMQALSSGLFGSLLWVGLAQLLVFLTDRAAADTAKLVQLQRSASAWQAAHAVRQRERRVQIQQALSVAGPVLARTIAEQGALGPEERVQARLAEGRLRDELRGARLLNDAVRHELEEARRRGATVTVLDEGGLEDIDAASMERIRHGLVEALRSARSDRLYIRTSPHERVAVTVVGRSDAGRGLSDDDTVDLWREILRDPGGE